MRPSLRFLHRHAPPRPRVLGRLRLDACPDLSGPGRGQGRRAASQALY